MRNGWKGIYAGLVGLAMCGVSRATEVPAAAAPPARDCFRASEWQGWKAPSDDVIYVRVRMHDVYQIGLTVGSPMLRAPAVHLVSIVRGSEMICGPIDLDLKVADNFGHPEGLIANSLRKMTPEEVAAIPEKYRP